MDHHIDPIAGAKTKAPPPYSEDEHNEYDASAAHTPPKAKSAPALGTAPNDEPYDPLDTDYGDVPADTQAPQAPRNPTTTTGNDEPFDPLDNEYDLPESVVEEQRRRQRERGQRRRSSLSALATMVRRHSGILSQRPAVDDGDDATDIEADDAVDPLACDYRPPDMPDKYRAKLNDTGSINVHVDLPEGTPPTPATPSPPVVEHFDPLFNECPPLNIVIFIVGSRGDVQPYLALALELIKARSHRVRIATHGAFKKLITDARVYLADMKDATGAPLANKLEFFDIGGDPQELMAYMVRNPGLLPGMSSIINGDVKTKRKMVKTILAGCYRACFSPNESSGKLFAPDAIISNPPAFAHIHCAEALGIPLIMSFTMPWTPTIAFPHPLVRMESNRTDEGVNNYSSYVLADALMWQGLGDLINTFRCTALGIRPLQLTCGPRILERLKIPVTYAWSQSLLPKPKDWKSNIDIVGFYSMPSLPSSSSTERSSDAKVDPAIRDFLSKGEPPIYVGFGSIVVKDPAALTEIILSAIEKAGVRAILSSGWADLGGHGSKPSSNVLVVKGDIAHDWLFADGRVSAVCHHGGAGTTAAGLRHGVPTIIVPFFGDQWFWGTAVANAGAGPAPIPYAQLTADGLAEAIKFALRPETREAVGKVGEQIRSETGTKGGVESFHKHLPLLNMRCEIDDKRTALWWCEKYCIRLSGAVAAVLVDEKQIAWNDLSPHRSMGYEGTRHYTDPFTAITHSFVNLTSQAVTGTGQLFYAPVKGLSNLFWELPKSYIGIVGSFHEGLDNIPGMMGSPMRDRDEIKNFRTGMLEGVKGLGYGIWDGVTGLVTEPLEGAKKDGVGGFFTGMGKSWVNVMARPASGALGLVVHPTTGAIRGIRSRMGKTGLIDAVNVLTLPRKAQSVAEARAVTANERQAIVRTWKKVTSDELVESRRINKRKQQTEREARLLKDKDRPTWSGVSGELMERLCTRGRTSFLAELDEVTRKAEAMDESETSSVQSGTIPEETEGGHGITIVRDGTPSGSSQSDMHPIRVEILPASTTTSVTASGAASPGASMADLTLAGTERWDWSRPSSRASGGSYTAHPWVKELDHRGQEKERAE